MIYAQLKTVPQWKSPLTPVIYGGFALGSGWLLASALGTHEAPELWGIVMIVVIEIGMITPPIGLNLFVTSGITGMSLLRVVKAAMPFCAVLFLFLILVTYVPALSTWLPYSLMGPELTVR